jgi:hypothetical protein
MGVNHHRGCHRPCSWVTLTKQEPETLRTLVGKDLVCFS